MVIDCMKSFGMPGKEVEQTLDQISIATSKSPIPDDPAPPFNPSGLRLGTPAATTRGMKEGDMEQLASWMIEAIKSKEDSAALGKIRLKVEEFCLKFKVPGIE